MDVFGKYVAQQARQAAQTASRIAQQKAAFDAAVRARQAAAAATQVASGGFSGGGGGGNAAASFGNAVAQMAAQAAPAAMSPAPRMETFGERIARQIVESYGVPNTPPPTYAAPPVNPAGVPGPTAPLPGMARTEADPWNWPDVKARFGVATQPPPQVVADLPDPGFAVTAPPTMARVNRDTTPTPASSSFEDLLPTSAPIVFEDGSTAPRNPQKPLKVFEDDPRLRQGFGNVAGVSAALARQATGIAGGENILDFTKRQAERAASEVRKQRQPDSPFITIKNQKTGQELTIDAGRAPNVGGDWVIVGTAQTQPEADKDTGAAGTGVLGDKGVTPEKIDAAVGGLANPLNIVDDLWSLGTIFARNPDQIPVVGNAAARFMERWQKGGPVDAIMGTLKDGFGELFDAAQIGQRINAQNAIDTIMQVKLGTYRPGEGTILDVPSVLTAALTSEAMDALGMVDIRADQQRGVVTAGSVGFDTWYDDTSTVVYEDGTTYTVRNDDIANNPGAFTGTVILPNKERANEAYTKGIDTDGDGQADLTGAAAVTHVYEADTGIAGTFIWQTGTDPLTYIPFVTVGGAKVRSIGRAGRAASVTKVGEVGNRALELTGLGIEYGSRAIDEAGSLGAGLALDHIVTPIVRKGGRVLGLLEESNASRQMTEMGEAAGVGGALSTRTEGQVAPTLPDTRVSGAEGGEPVDLPTPRTPIAAEPEPGRGPERRTAGTDGGEPVTLQAPVARTVADTPDFERGPDLRTPDGGTIATRVADGEGGVVTRAVDENGVRAVERDGVPYQPRTLAPSTDGRTPSIDVSGVPPRYDRVIARSATINGAGPTQALVDEWRAAGRFIDNVNGQRAVGDALGTTEGTVDGALLTAQASREWNADMRAINPASVDLPLVRSTGQGWEHQRAMEILRQPWDTTGRGSNIRSSLYRLPSDNPNALRQTIPTNPTPGDLAAAERYADLVDEHLRWHPMDVNEPSYQRAMQQAAKIRKTLDDLDYAGRRGGGITRGGRAVRDANTRSAVADGEDATLRAGRDTTADDEFANAPQTARADIAAADGVEQIGGYPVIDEGRVRLNGKDYEAKTVELDDDTIVEIVPVPRRSVPASETKQYAGAANLAVWHRGDLIDDAMPDAITVYAPEPEQVVERAVAEAEARGLLGDAPQAAPSPTNRTPSPSGRAAPAPKPEPAVWPSQPSRRPPDGRVGPKVAEPAVKRVWDNAKAAATKEDGIAVFREYAEGKYGPRDEAMHFSQRKNRQGGLAEPDKVVYNATRDGRGWKAVDGYIEGFSRDWDELRGPDYTPPSPNGRATQPDTIITDRSASAGEARPTMTPTGEEIPADTLTPVAANGKKPGLRAAKQEAPTAPAIVQEAIAQGWVADEATGMSLLQNVVGPRNWTIEDTRYIMGQLHELRAAHGITAPIADHIDLANPEIRAMLDKAERLANKQAAIDLHQQIVKSTHVTPAAKKGVQANLKKLQAEMDALRKEMKFPAKGERSAGVVKKTMDPEAQTALGKLNPPGKREKSYLDNLRKLTTLEAGPNPARGLTVDRNGFTRFHGATLTDDELEALTRHTFENGDTLLDRWNTYLSDTVAARESMTLAGDDSVQVALDMALRDYDELLKQLFPVREVRNRFLKGVRTFSRYLREKILGSWLSAPRYVGTQMLGNPILLSLGGYGDPETLTRMAAGVRRAWEAERQMAKLTGADLFDTSHAILHSDRIAVEWGTSRGPEVMRHVSSGTDLSTDYGVVESWFRKHGVPGATAARAIAGDPRVIRLGGAFDMAARDTVFTAAFQREIKNQITGFRLDTTRLLMESGMTRRQAVETLDRFRATNPKAFTSTDVRTFFKDYLTDGQAERLGRDWQSRVNRTSTHARNEVVRVTFSGKETKLDAFLKNVILFHHFTSRQYLYLWRQALHHPGLINLYVRANEALGEYAKEHDLPPWLVGTIRFALSGPGAAVYLNPTTLVQAGNLFGAPDVDFGDDGNWLTGVLDGPLGDFVFIHPVFTDALNLFGFLGDNRDLDPFRLMQEANAFQLAWNWGTQSGWIPGHENLWLGNPATNAGNWVRSQVSGLLPGSEQVAFVNEAEGEQRQIQGLIVDEAKQAGIDPETPEGQAQIAAIIDDPSDPIHQRAVGRYLWGETIAVGARLIPGLASFRPQVRAINAEGKDLLTNTTANERRLQNTTNDNALKIKVQSNQYYNLADEEAGVVDLIYQDIVFSDQVFFDVTVDGKTYHHNQIEKMSDEERKKLAQAWMAENNVRGIWQKKQDDEAAFLANPDNREFAQYKSWQRGLLDYEGGVEQYWKDVIEGNPNAKRYYEGLDPNLTPKQRQKALTGTYAFMAVAGIPTGWAQDEKGEWYPTSDYRSPQPLSTRGYDPLDIANGPAKPIAQEPYENPYAENLRKDMDNYQRYRAEDEVILQQIYAEWGLPPDTRLGEVPYKTRKAIEAEFKDRNDGYGVSQPSGSLKAYFKWRDKHPGMSLDAYIRWKDFQYEENLPENFTKSQEQPKGAALDTDAYEYYDMDTWRGN